MPFVPFQPAQPPVCPGGRLLMIYGAVTAARTPVDVFPGLNKPVVWS
jgi:hypothetical protein